MVTKDYFQEDLARAQAALEKTETTHGKDHVLVSHRLDEVAKLLRSANKDLARAAQLEQRARAIRIKINEQDKAKQRENQDSQAMWEAVRESTAKHNRARVRKQMVMLSLIVVAALAAGKVLLAPSAQESQMRESFLTNLSNMNPSKLVNDMFDKSTAAAKEAAAAEKARTDQIDNMVDSSTSDTSK